MNQPKASAGHYAVLGGGSWGTALAQLLARKGGRVVLWAREPEVVQSITDERENRVFLPGVKLNDNLVATTDIAQALAGAELVLFTVPTQFLRSFLARNRELFPHGVPLVCCSKGIEKGSLMTPDEILLDELPGKHHNWLALLSGPSFALEVAQSMPTNVTIASRNPEVGLQVQKAVADYYFRAYTSSDVTGVAMGGALKNVIALAAGASDGLGFGHNARAGLITRGLAEITCLAVRRGANPLTLAGLSGMGDLVLTCTGELSRNRQVGYRMARGETIKQIVDSMRMVAEGVATSDSVHYLGRKLEVDMPISTEVYLAIHEGKPVDEAVASLLGRPVGREIRC